MTNTKKLLATLLGGLQIAVPTFSWAQSAPTTTFAYDAVGQVTSVTLPGGRVNQLQWDALGRNVQQSRAGAAVVYGYNYQDALTAVQDPRGLVTSYDRNGFGEARSQSSPDTGNTTFSRDAAGNVTSRVNAAGQVENYTFDAGNRVTNKTLSHPASGSIAYGFTYGTSGIEAGELVQVSAPGLVLSYAHNLYGQVTSATQALSGTASLTTGYGYANNGAPTSVTYPSGRVVSYTLDGASRISGITVDGTAVLSGISYSALGAVTGWSFTGGQAVSRTFDANARTTSVTMPWGPRQYSYDVDDRIVGINDTLLGSASYAYDNQDRLTSASNAAGSWTYQYDANGNRTAATISGSGYGTSVDNGSNRMLAAGQRQVTFTADGQPSQVTSAAVPMACGTSLTLGYQADGQLVTSNVLSAVHAPNGLRLQKTAAACAGGAKTNFVYDTAGHLIGEYDAVGAVIRETVWLGDLPVAVYQASGSSAAAYYVYADNLGTPRGITTAGGMLVWSWDGEPFGATPAISGQLGQQGAFAYGLRFPGQYLDEETGYHHNGWREYDPAVGRYVQSDPIGLAGGLNTYAYVGGNPLAMSDPMGLEGRINNFHALYDRGLWKSAEMLQMPGWFIYAGHMNNVGGEDQTGLPKKKWETPMQMAKRAKNHPDWKKQPVALLGCHSGEEAADGGPSPAQIMANELGVPVLAAPDFAWFPQAGISKWLPAWASSNTYSVPTSAGADHSTGNYVRIPGTEQQLKIFYPK